MAFEETKTSTRDDSLIPNSQIESMFMRVCDDDQMKQYMQLIDNGHISLATAYASNLVYKTFYALVEQWEKYKSIKDVVKEQKKGKK